MLCPSAEEVKYGSMRVNVGQYYCKIYSQLYICETLFTAFGNSSHIHTYPQTSCAPQGIYLQEDFSAGDGVAVGQHVLVIY